MYLKKKLDKVLIKVQVCLSDDSPLTFGKGNFVLSHLSLRVGVFSISADISAHLLGEEMQ